MGDRSRQMGVRSCQMRVRSCQIALSPIWYTTMHTITHKDVRHSIIGDRGAVVTAVIDVQHAPRSPHCAGGGDHALREARAYYYRIEVGR